MRTQFQKKYEDLISLENLFAAWAEFISGKRKKRDVQEFSLRLTDNLVQLHSELVNFTYAHGGYQAFNISDPKPRNIHKASVRDRVLHHAIYRQLYLFFDQTFIADSFSCRVDKGVHKALNRFRTVALKVSKNNTRTVWVLKMDIKKFFANIDHKVLLNILKSYISTPTSSSLKEGGEREGVMWLLEKVIRSFSVVPGRGLPLGNLTSQLFCNVYMNKFDQFVKRKLHVKYYLRYADDFVFFSDDREWLAKHIWAISDFLDKGLKLSLHPDKIFLRTLASGVDFLGWVHFPSHRVLRTVTSRRMFRRIQQTPQNEVLQSYLGLLGHGHTFKVKQKILNWYALWAEKDQNN